MFGDFYDKQKFKISSWISSWLTSSARLASEGQLSEFIEGLGPGQLVGRQVLASPSLGEIQLSVCDRRGNLEVEVIRARGLQCKPGSKVLPGKCLIQIQTYMQGLICTFLEWKLTFVNRFALWYNIIFREDTKVTMIMHW